MTIRNNHGESNQHIQTTIATTRHPFIKSIIIKQAGILCSLLILMTMVPATTAVSNSNNDHIRHHHSNQPQQDDEAPEDIYVTQLEEQRLPTCPNCLYKDDETLLLTNRASRRKNSDSLRLEAIKRQILTKLGLRHKPNVTKAALMMPRKVVIETLFRAEDGVSGAGSDGGARHEYDVSEGEGVVVDGGDNSFDGDSAYATEDVDDFYGRTSEIISFPEQGYKVNGNRLLEFRVSPESGQLGQEFRIRAATLWLKADIRYTRTHHCRTTEIYVFKFKVALQESVKLNSRDFSRLTDYPLTLYLNETTPGWQKIDITTTVRDWLTDTPQDKLRLFVDCSCCSGLWNIHLLNHDGVVGGGGGGGGGASSSTTSAAGGRYQEEAGGAEVDAANRPFLVIHTDPAQTKRVRRRALDCSPDSGNQCCKQRFYVSFRELGWEDWIIAPQGYYANYCRGDCGAAGAYPHLNTGHHRTPDTYANYHTHVIEEIRKTHHLSGMQPCCAPLKFSSMSLIYFGPDANIIKRDLPKMVVDECGCP